jgi:hypothetical protein
MAALCVALPLAVSAAALLFTGRTELLLDQQLGQPVSSASLAQVQLTISAEAQRIQAQLGGVEYGVSVLAINAQKVLSNPPAYAPHPPQAAQDAAAPPRQPDNPAYYVRGADGALRKRIDDGQSAVFFRAREGGGVFSEYDHQRLYGTAVMDPLLKGLTEASPLCGQTYIATKDGLVRTYPYRDLSLWPGDRDLSKLPMYAWSKDKASGRGIVWGGPYLSKLTGEWVLGCLAPITFGDKLVAVAGCEVPLSRLADNLLAFSLGPDGSCWLMRPGGQILALQSGADRLLGLNVATADKDESKASAGDAGALNAFLGTNKDAASLLKSMLAQQKLADVPQRLPDGSYLAAARVMGTDWVLAGVMRSGAIDALSAFRKELAREGHLRLLLIACALVGGLALAVVLAWYNTKLLTQPLRILTSQVTQAAASATASAVAIADEGEIGALAEAVQGLIDQAFPSHVMSGPTPAEPTTVEEANPAPPALEEPDSPKS